MKIPLDSQRCQNDPLERHWTAKVAPMAPKSAKMEPKRSLLEPKADPFGTKLAIAAPCENLSIY